MKAKAVSDKINISEIFSSLQGEGIYIGEKQIFLRFAGCNLNCDFCDERDKRSREWLLEEVIATIEKLERAKGPHGHVSLTGGEPLLHVDFLKVLLPRLVERGFRIYLETNGTLPDELSEIIVYVGVVAMDVKLGSVTGEETDFEQNKRFIKIAKQKPLFIKLVVSPKLNLEELVKVVEFIAEADPKIPVVLQPVSTKEDPYGKSQIKFLERVRFLAAEYLKNVRIIPRLQKILDIR